MLSKEEIEKAKEYIVGLIYLFYNFPNPQSVLLEDNKVQYVETLLQYIQELEQENKRLNEYCLSYEKDLSVTEVSLKKAEMIIDKMTKWIYDKDYNSQEILLLQERYEDYYGNNLKKIKQYFEKKVDKNKI